MLQYEVGSEKAEVRIVGTEDDGREGGDRTVPGTIVAILPRALYRVAVGEGYEVIAHAPSGPGRNFVRLVVGDRVAVELSRRDKARGRITRRT
jgi:translation initiation factor IF-1